MNPPKERNNIRSKTIMVPKGLPAIPEVIKAARRGSAQPIAPFMMNKENQNKFKVVLVGDPCVGKTAILNRFIHNTFKKEYNCTIGVEFWVKSVNCNDTVVDLQIWDTCGQERYRTITKQYYREVNGCILAFDLTKKETFENIKNWLKDIQEHGTKIKNIVLVGNKLDLAEERIVSQKEVEDIIDSQNLVYFEVSAKSGENVFTCFDRIAELMLENKQNEIRKGLQKGDYAKNNSISLDNHPEKKKKKCC
jgi:small GTP-binding protein